METGFVLSLLYTLAICGSLFYGCCANIIFGVKPSPTRSAQAHQFILNFAGSLFGWAALIILVRKFFLIAGPSPQFDFFADFMLALVAFVGVTGHLPVTIVNSLIGLLQAIEVLKRKVAAYVEKKSDDASA